MGPGETASQVRATLMAQEQPASQQQEGMQDGGAAVCCCAGPAPLLPG